MPFERPERDTSKKRDNSSLGACAPLVFIHGFLETEAVFTTFEARNRLLTAGAHHLRLPGHHPDDTVAATDAQLHRNRFLDSFAAELEARFGPRPVRLVAHSTGGLAGLALAHAYPDRVSDLLIMGALSSGRMDGHASAHCQVSTAPLIGAPIFSAGLRFALRSPERFRAQIASVTAAPARPPDVSDDIRRTLLRVDPAVLHRVLLWLMEFDLGAHLPRIEAPVLSVIGMRDPVVPPQHQLNLLRKLPNGHAHLLDTGHLPFLEAPDAIDDLFTAWLAKPLYDAQQMPAANADLATMRPERHDCDGQRRLS